MVKYNYLDHTADVKFEAFGEDLREAFANCVLAMVNVTFDSSKINKDVEKTISVKGMDLKSVLFKFLEEFIFLSDSENFVPCEIVVNKLSDSEVSAVAFGSCDVKENVGPQVKAVTYNDMIISSSPVRVQVVLDI